MRTIGCQYLIIFSILLSTVVFWSNPLLSQNFKPKQVSFVAYDNLGKPIKTVTFALTVTLKDPKGTGNIFYKENHFATSDTAGMITISVGEGKAEAGFVETASPSGADCFFQIEGIEIGAETNRKTHAGFIIQLNQTENANENISNQKLKISDEYAGGIIFFLDSTGFHGKVVMAVDLDCKLSYGCTDIMINSYSPTDGQLNTILINKNCSERSAASVCAASNIGGYKDWYLPSISELLLIYKNLSTKIQFNHEPYWSSTECDDCADPRSWGARLNIQGVAKAMFKSRPCCARGIRRF